jgi:hypothetical protein
MTTSIDRVTAVWAPPQTVARLLREHGLRNASATEEAGALRSWLSENRPSPALRISIRRNGYGLVFGRRFGR